MKRVLGFFFQGLLYTLPLAVTIYVLYGAFSFIDDLLRQSALMDNKWLAPFDFPGIGIILVFVLVTVIGFLGQVFVNQPIQDAFNRTLERAPLIKVIYSSVKDLLSAFVGKERKFEKPVLVRLNKEMEVERIGFITQNDLHYLGLKEKIAVYLPSSYGVLGELYVVPRENITIIEKPAAEVMKFIVSGGVTRLE